MNLSNLDFKNENNDQEFEKEDLSLSDDEDFTMEIHDTEFDAITKGTQAIQKLDNLLTHNFW